MDPLTRYDYLVDTDEKTSEGCPTQWEGLLNDGRVFYFRYRHGRAYLGVAHDKDAAVFAGESGGVESVTHIERMADGYMDDDEYREVFVKLYDALV